MSEYFTRAVARAGPLDPVPVQAEARPAGREVVRQPREIEKASPDAGDDIRDGEPDPRPTVETDPRLEAASMEQTATDPWPDPAGAPQGAPVAPVEGAEQLAPVADAAQHRPLFAEPPGSPSGGTPLAPDYPDDQQLDVVSFRPVEPVIEDGTLRGAAAEPLPVDDRRLRPAVPAELLQGDAPSLVSTADIRADEDVSGRADPDDDRLAAADAFMFDLLEQSPTETDVHDEPPGPARSADEPAQPAVVIQTVSIEIVDDGPRSEPPLPAPRPGSRATGVLAPSRWCGTTRGW